MKKYRIFAFPSHQAKERTSGVDFARIIQPMTYLAKHPDFEVELFDINKKTDWLAVSQRIDMIYFNYLQDPWGYAAMGAMARKNGVKMVLDLDDSLWDIATDNTAYKVFHPGSEALKNFEAICNDVDYITTTNNYLKNVITHHTMKRHEKIKILPNYIDLDLYNHRSSPKDENQVTLMHFGSTTHFIDLANAEFERGVDMIMREYPNVVLKTIGAMIGKYKQKWGARYFNDYGHQDIYHWIQDTDRFPKFMDEADIMVTPLVANTYNKCKSSIKFLEASSAKKAGVWQKIRQYEEVVDGENGLLAESAQQWHDQLKLLIDDAQLRKQMGENAFKTIVDDHQIQNHVKDYAQTFRDILTEE